MAVRSRRATRDQNTPSEPTQRGGGEQIDVAAEQSIRLAHRALNRFPDLMRRHRYVAGGAAVAGALVVLASVAIARRMRHGESGEEAADRVTEAEIESLHPREREASSPAEGTTPAAPASPARVPHTNGASATSPAAHTRERGSLEG